MKLSSMRTVDQVVEENRRQDPEFREQWDRTAFAREVAITVVRYRAEHGMSQRDLAAATALAQPAIARLEKAEHQPSLDTLAKLSIGTGLEFRVGVTRGAIELLAVPAQRTSKATPKVAAPAKVRSRLKPAVSTRSAARTASVRRSATKSSKATRNTAGSALSQGATKKASDTTTRRSAASA